MEDDVGPSERDGQAAGGEEEEEIAINVEPLATEGVHMGRRGWSGPTFGGVRIPPLTTEERMQLRAVNVEVPNVPLFEDISLANGLVCDMGLELSEPEPDGQNELISMGMIFDSLDELKHFMRDYSVRHHRPFNVVHSDKKKRYTVMCQKGCGWGVWARPKVGHGSQWKITKVKVPHTCGSAHASQVHSQCTARYIARRIASLVYTEPEISIKALIKVIAGWTNYQVQYGKAWRAKQHAMAMMWGDWSATYGQVPRLLNAMRHFNPGLK